MTRKQALMRVCEFLKQDGENEESIEIQQKVQEIINDMPFTRWSDDTIFDTFNQWILEHNRIPTTRDMARKGLPPIPVIKNRFGLTGKEFIDTYYPRESPKCNSLKYGFKTREDWLEIFKFEYQRIKPVSSVDFNRKRNPEIPTWATIAKMMDLSTWLQLLNCCNLTKHRRKRKVCTRKMSGFTVTRHVDIFEKLAELDDINS